MSEADTVHARFAVIGSPGHGKSYWLNDFANTAGLFEVDGGRGSCTQAGTPEWDARNQREVTVEDEELQKTYKFTLQDTPGFPDPRVERAAGYYDAVVEKCNEPLNGVVFVLKPERLCADLVDRYKTLLKEFVRLKPPVFMIVNGTEPAFRPKKEKEADYEKRRADGLQKFRETALEICSQVDLVCREIFVSFTAEDLEDFRLDLARLLVSAKAEPSQLKTYQQLKADLAEAERYPEVMLRQELERQQAVLDKKIADKAYHERRAEVCGRLANGEVLACEGLGDLINALKSKVGFTGAAESLRKLSMERLRELGPDIESTRQQRERMRVDADAQADLRERVSQMAQYLCPELLQK